MKIKTTLPLILSALFFSLPLGAIDKQMIADGVLVNMDAMAPQVTVADIMSMNAKEFSARTGQKMSLKQKIGYGLMKGQLKRAVKKGELSLNDSATAAVAASDGSFNVGAFFLGFLFGLLGVLIVAIAFEDKKAWISALIGLGAFLVLYILLIASLL
jgi:hypothetical protein